MGSVHCAAAECGRRFGICYLTALQIIPLKIKMPKIVIHYFDFPFWRAEVSRLALHLGKVEFDDKKIKDFKEFKESGKAPFGQAPILEVDGKVISQTGAIARYCGKQGGLYPRDDDFAAAKIDELIDTATDITCLIGPTMRMAEEEKLEARKKLAEDKIPMYLAALEAIMIANGSTGFFVGDKMTIADIALWRLFGWLKGGNLDGLPTDLIDKHPLLLKSFNDIDTHPQIKSWMDSHYAK